MKALVIGLGSMGKRRVRNLIALGVKDIAGFDLRQDRRDEARERYGVSVFGSLEEAMKFQPDVLVISVPPDLHMKYAQVAVNAGKPFFIEASVTDEGVEELIASLKRTKIVGVPSSTMRFFPGPRRIRELVKSGAIGKVYFWQYQSGQYLPDWHPWEPLQDVYYSKCETGGCREIVPFELVWLTWVFGDVTEVDGRKARQGNLAADIDDVYMLQLRHSNGVLGQLTVDVLGRAAARDMRVTGELGTIEWDDNTKKIRVYNALAKTWADEDLGVGSVEKQYINPEEPYIAEMKEFLEAVHVGQSVYTFEEDHRLLRLLYQAEESDAQGKRMRGLS